MALPCWLSPKCHEPPKLAKTQAFFTSYHYHDYQHDWEMLHWRPNKFWFGLVSYHQLGEFGVEFLLIGHGQGRGDGLQAERSGPVHHAVSDFGRLVISPTATPAPPFQFGRHALHFDGIRGRCGLGVVATAVERFQRFGQGGEVGMKAVEFLGQVWFGQIRIVWKMNIGQGGRSR